MTWKQQLDFYTEKLGEALDSYERDHPEWQTESLLWIVDHGLRSLRSILESPAEREVSWKAPFVELHFPVDCQLETMDTGPTFKLNAGILTKQNLKDEDSAVNTLTEIMVRQLEIVTLQEATSYTAYAQEDDSYRPMLSTELVEKLEAIESDEDRSNELRSLLQPCSFGAGTIEFPPDMQSGDTIPEWVAVQLSKVRPPLVMIPMLAGKEGTDIAVIFEVHPLVINFAKKKAYFPLTIGLTIFTAPSNIKDNPSPPWEQFSNWTSGEREQLWASLFAAITDRLSQLGPSKSTDVEKAVLVVNAKIQIKQGEKESADELQQRALDELQRLGTVLQFDSRLSAGLTTTPEVKALGALQAVDDAQTNEEKGRSLEKLITVLFETIEGFSVSERTRTQTEEIDLFVVNTGDVPAFRQEGRIILVECKYWAKKCGKDEFVLFRAKMANRGDRCTLGFLVSWNGFASTFTSEMLRSSREKLLVVPLDGTQIRAAIESNKFLDCLLDAWKKALSV